MKRYLRKPSAWVGIGLSAFVMVVAAISTGVGGALVMAGLIALGTGLYTLVTRRPSWLALAGRKAGAGIMTGALVAVFVGGGVYGATNPGAAPAPASPASSTAAEPTVTSSVPTAAVPTPTPAPTTAAASPTPTTPSPAATATAPKAPPGTARALLETIPVKGRAPKTGYDRTDKFGAAWKDVDRNGCDTRNDILRRDLAKITVKANTHGCVVLTGVLHSPYTNGTIDFQRGQSTSTAVQIDHVVALMDAWQSGAQLLSQAQREALANDPLNLLAVDGHSNSQKQAGNAATWLPAAKGYRCAYVARQITVKAEYDLWVTAPEHDAMVRILQACPQQKTASAGTITLMPDAVATTPAPKKTTSTQPVPKKTTAPKPAPKKTTAPKPAPQKTSAPKPAPHVVHPGSFCAPEGAHGVTTKGTSMRCTLKAGEDRARWRKS